MNSRFCCLTAVLVIAAACTRTENTTHAAGKTPATSTDVMSQSNAQSDLDHLAEIRKTIVADDTLSVAAKNVQVLTKDGNVLLRGKVPSAGERDAVARHAKSCPQTKTVDDQLVVEAN